MRSSYINSIFFFKQVLNFVLLLLFFGCSHQVIDDSVHNVTNVDNDFTWSASTSSKWLIKVSSVQTKKKVIGFLKANETIFASAEMENNQFSFSAKMPSDMVDILFECPACGITGIKVESRGGIYDFTENSNQRLQNSIDTTFNSIDVNGGVLTVDGVSMGLQSDYYQKIVLKNKAKVVFLTETTVDTLYAEETAMNNLVVSSNGIFTLNQGLNDRRINITNFGKITIDGTVVLSVNAFLDNKSSAEITITDLLDNNSSLTNNGVITIGKNYQNNFSGSAINYCKIVVEGDFEQNNTFENNGFINVKGDIRINGGSSCNLGINSFIFGESNLTIWGNLIASGETLLKVERDISIGGGAKVDNVKFTTPNDSFLSNYSGISDSSLLINYADHSSLLQDQGTCGYLFISSNSSYNLRYPSNGDVTIAFEDLWPTEGDYDFNDILFNYHITYEVNQNNHIVSMVIDGEYLSKGGYIENGIGLRWLVNYSDASTTFFKNSKNNNVELNTLNVVRLTDNLNNEIGIFYKESNLPKNKSFSLTLQFEDAIDASIISSFTIDPFLFKKNERGHEIHLPNFSNTSLCDVSKFKTFDDDTNQSSKWYKTLTNMPWGLELLTGSESFKIPNENTNIKDAYPDFESWVNSNGAYHTNWYAYPVESKVY